MSKREQKARAQVAQYEVTLTTGGDAESIIAACDRAAEGASAGRWLGSIERASLKFGKGGSFVAGYVMRGPGRVMKVMTFAIIAQRVSDGRFRVGLDVISFVYDKGNMLTGPNVPVAKSLEKYVGLLKAEFAALDTSSPSGLRSDVALCERCGGTLEIDDLFCGNCGQPHP